MTLQEIREECWFRARDAALVDSDRLWPTNEINSYINRIYREIARETRCIKDNSTVGLCLITSTPVDYTTYEAGTLDYLWANDSSSWLFQKDVCPYLFDIDPRIIGIEEVKWVNRAWKLIKVSSRKWQINPWWERTSGMPTEYATDLATGKLALNFRDGVSDTLQLQVRRMPLVGLVSDTDEPEFRQSYHDFFVNGVLWLMYSKQDADAINKEKAQYHYELYQRDIDEIKQQESLLNEQLGANGSLLAFR